MTFIDWILKFMGLQHNFFKIFFQFRSVSKYRWHALVKVLLQLLIYIFWILLFFMWCIFFQFKFFASISQISQISLKDVTLHGKKNVRKCQKSKSLRHFVQWSIKTFPEYYQTSALAKTYRTFTGFRESFQTTWVTKL